MAEPVVINLSSPIEFAGKRYDTITVRPIKAKDLRRCQAKPGDDSLGWVLEMAGYLTGEVDQVIDELEGEDLGAVLAAVSAFSQVIQ